VNTAFLVTGNPSKLEKIHPVYLTNKTRAVIRQLLSK